VAPGAGDSSGEEQRAAGGASEQRLLVKTPAGGSYLAWLEGRGVGAATVAPVAFAGAEVSLAAPKATDGIANWMLVVLDQKTGYSAAKKLPTKLPDGVTLVPTDFNRVHRVRVQVTGAGGKPVTSGSATLTDAGSEATTRVWDPFASGTVEFTAVRAGTARLQVQPTSGASTIKEVEIRLNPGETVQTLTVALPEVATVVEGAAPAAGTTSTPELRAPPANAPAAAEPMPPPSGTSPITTLVGFILLAGAIYAFYVAGKNRGWTVDKALARLGVQSGPEPATAAGPASLRPAPAPPPPVDPNVCAFCGERKDPATGRCACSLDASVGAAAPFTPAPATGSGPRLVAVQGVYMGQVFPLGGEATIGRDPGTEVPLAEDTTVSRRHARIRASDGGYRLEDLGSSNGTFVNGGRVTEAPLRPGDEVSIGGTRFRFES
jgi:hypothetical protein